MPKTFTVGQVLSASDVNNELNPWTAPHLIAAAHAQTLNATISASRYVDVAITFPAGRFTANPLVFATLLGSAGDVSATVRGWSTSTTAGMIRAAIPATGTTTVVVQVLAIQMTQTSATS
ncbi:hypothetical protein ACQCX5_14375 [Propionibacteriaceae bacterium G57]|uniref:hypothetical protein n=1 Tax=Aestuariimicrobium sp. G57 TaxID=3418485 RepID=UPI003DA77C72